MPKLPIAIATANTHWGRTIKTQNGLKPLLNVDILLLQEVGELQKRGTRGAAQ